jgi:glycosyltransferase involved in cell wall biosynthesis
MKILWLTENYPPNRGGMAQSCDRIVFHLRKIGVEIDLIHFTQHSPEIKINQTQLGKDITFPADEDLAHTFNCLFNFLENYLTQEKHTRLAVFGGYATMFFAPFISKMFNLTLITLLRGNDFDAGLFSPRRKQIVEDCLLQSSLVCSVSKDKIFKINQLYKNINTVYTPNGIDLEHWQTLPTDIQHAENWRKTHIDYSHKVIGLFGHLKEKKGGLFFLREILKADVQEKIHLLIVGEMQTEMRDFLQAEQEIRYTHYDFIDRYSLLGYYPACDVVAIPSFYDGMPNVLLEAMGLGVPILGANVAGMADVLSAEIAFLFEPANGESCREALRRFVQTSKTDLEQMGKKSLELVKNNYTHTQEAIRYKTAFENICNAPDFPKD